MTTDQIITITIAGVSFGVSILSLFFNLRRDSKRVMFSIYRGSIYNLSPTGEVFGEAVDSTQIDIVNYGFRPVCISSAGGDYHDPISMTVKR